jgi:hypothetical protein
VRSKINLFPGKAGKKRDCRYLRGAFHVKFERFHVSVSREGSYFIAEVAETAEERRGEQRERVLARCVHNFSRLKKYAHQVCGAESGVNRSPLSEAGLYSHTAFSG